MKTNTFLIRISGIKFRYTKQDFCVEAYGNFPTLSSVCEFLTVHPELLENAPYIFEFQSAVFSFHLEKDEYGTTVTMIDYCDYAKNK